MVADGCRRSCASGVLGVQRHIFCCICVHVYYYKCAYVRRTSHAGANFSHKDGPVVAGHAGPVPGTRRGGGDRVARSLRSIAQQRALALAFPRDEPRRRMTSSCCPPTAGRCWSLLVCRAYHKVDRVHLTPRTAHQGRLAPILKPSAAA